MGDGLQGCETVGWGRDSGRMTQPVPSREVSRSPSRLPVAMRREQGIDEADEGKSQKERKVGLCELCGRSGRSLSFHHLIPRHCHRKRRFRQRFTIEEMRSRGLWLCKGCHGGIHDLVPDEKVLGWSYNTKDLLLAHEGVRKHVGWVRKQR